MSDGQSGGWEGFLEKVCLEFRVEESGSDGCESGGDGAGGLKCHGDDKQFSSIPVDCSTNILHACSPSLTEGNYFSLLAYTNSSR